MATQFRPMALTSIDHMMPICYISFFYSLSLKNPAQGVNVLGEALNRLVKECPFLAGNVGRSGENDAARKNVLEIQPASIDTFAQYPLLRVSPHECQSITDRDPADGLFDDAYRALPLSLATDFPCPIIRWQANVMRDGIVIAVSFHHSVLDAGGFYMIQQALARLCRNPNSSYLEISLDSSLLQGRHCLSQIQSISPCADLQREDESIIRMADFDLPANLVSYRLTLLHCRIQSLQDCCNAQISTESTGQHLSPNDVVSGLLWRSIILARSPLKLSPSIDSSDEQSTLILISEIRRTLMPALPRSYLGNAIVQQVANTYTKAVLEPSTPEHNELVQLTRLAQKVHDASTQVTDLRVKSLLRQKQGTLDWRPQFMQGDVMSTSLRRMPIYDLDFGTVLGKVVGFDSPDNRIDGTVCILPASSLPLDSLWDIRITLPPNVLSRLRQDPILQWAMGRDVHPRL
ncbi:unnamed protein product [Penicillium salamii]|uniref:Uncharacterized protein n=1 Tax=Penicillium salamii TaxID=1612424 RepID=A0A9W4N571_9EURO|nr:unnamed protein product [Penicillium salamii]CAG7959965.1 unnamed protein product [Penicillium salamii]CAG7963598.1 unnamed protein product [Penicillium salamii]CAG7981408.1 unnamed protein product [Penicillium salamii]CAG8258430.1 unnamed protein product [Penicillium salamii]